MANRFENNNTGTAAFINLYDGKNKIVDVEVLTKLVDDIEAGTVKVECYINKETGEPVMMIRR